MRKEGRKPGVGCHHQPCPTSTLPRGRPRWPKKEACHPRSPSSTPFIIMISSLSLLRSFLHLQLLQLSNFKPLELLQLLAMAEHEVLLNLNRLKFISSLFVIQSIFSFKSSNTNHTSPLPTPTTHKHPKNQENTNKQAELHSFMVLVILKGYSEFYRSLIFFRTKTWEISASIWKKKKWIKNFHFTLNRFSLVLAGSLSTSIETQSIQKMWS